MQTPLARVARHILAAAALSAAHALAAAGAFYGWLALRWGGRADLSPVAVFGLISVAPLSSAFWCAVLLPKPRRNMTAGYTFWVSLGAGSATVIVPWFGLLFIGQFELSVISWAICVAFTWLELAVVHRWMRGRLFLNTNKFPESKA